MIFPECCDSAPKEVTRFNTAAHNLSLTTWFCKIACADEDFIGLILVLSESKVLKKNGKFRWEICRVKPDRNTVLAPVNWYSESSMFAVAMGETQQKELIGNTSWGKLY